MSLIYTYEQIGTGEIWTSLQRVETPASVGLSLLDSDSEDPEVEWVIEDFVRFQVNYLGSSGKKFLRWKKQELSNNGLYRRLR